MLDFVLTYASSATTSTHPILFSTTKAAAMILQPCGGHIIIVQGSHAIGEGSSSVRESVKTYGTTDEENLL